MGKCVGFAAMLDPCLAQVASRLAKIDSRLIKIDHGNFREILSSVAQLLTDEVPSVAKGEIAGLTAFAPAGLVARRPAAFVPDPESENGIRPLGGANGRRTQTIPRTCHQLRGGRRSVFFRRPVARVRVEPVGSVRETAPGSITLDGDLGRRGLGVKLHGPGQRGYTEGSLLGKPACVHPAPTGLRAGVGLFPATIRSHQSALAIHMDTRRFEWRL